MAKKTLIDFRVALHYIRTNVDGGMPVNQLSVFLEVCAQDGITQPEIMERTGIYQTATSRYVKQLGKYAIVENGSRVVKGLGLVRTEPDLVERRRLACFLTKKGRGVRDALVRITNGLEKKAAS